MWLRCLELQTNNSKVRGEGTGHGLCSKSRWASWTKPPNVQPNAGVRMDQGRPKVTESAPRLQGSHKKCSPDKQWDLFFYDQNLPGPTTQCGTIISHFLLAQMTSQVTPAIPRLRDGGDWKKGAQKVTGSVTMVMCEFKTGNRGRPAIVRCSWWVRFIHSTKIEVSRTELVLGIQTAHELGLSFF